jgi:hypothetical protein
MFSSKKKRRARENKEQFVENQKKKYHCKKTGKWR